MDKENGLKLFVENALIYMGASTKLLGFRYLVYAICAVVEDADVLLGIKKGTYTEIARAFDTDSDRVDHAIRYLIRYIYFNGSVDMYPTLVVEKFPWKLTNLEFISRMALICEKWLMEEQE